MGIRNTGNTCWANASLQALSTMLGFVLACAIIYQHPAAFSDVSWTRTTVYLMDRLCSKDRGCLIPAGCEPMFDTPVRVTC